MSEPRKWLATNGELEPKKKKTKQNDNRLFISGLFYYFKYNKKWEAS
jgi:hypothetical protein